MFRSYYGLSFNPFDKQNAREKDRFLSKDISEMTSRLDYLKDTRGIGLFTARPGMGKSFALRCFAKSLNPNLYHMEYICLSTVSVMEFYRQLCSVLGVEPRGGKPGMFRAMGVFMGMDFRFMAMKEFVSMISCLVVVMAFFFPPVYRHGNVGSCNTAFDGGFPGYPDAGDAQGVELGNERGLEAADAAALAAEILRLVPAACGQKARPSEGAAAGFRTAAAAGLGGALGAVCAADGYGHRRFLLS